LIGRKTAEERDDFCAVCLTARGKGRYNFSFSLAA